MYLQHFGFTAYPFDTDLKAEQLYRSASIEEVAKRLEHLIELRGIALITGEAHHLRNEVLEDLRLLTNFELDSQRRMCMLLVGLTELRRRLAMSMHESLAQRIVTQHHFAALTSSETEAYLWHRLQMAGAAELPYFEPNAIEALFNAARGMPRQINRIAHYALLAAFLDKAQQVSAEHVEKACAESRL